jgi:cobalt-zinc-cadmium efflux system membrane fusion protein
MKFIKQLLIFATVSFVFSDCGSKSQEPAEEPTDLVEITNLQFLTDSMQLGEIEKRVFESTVKCNGTIVPLPDGKAKVNALFQGVVSRILCENGQYVQVNQPLIEVTGNEILDIQNAFAEASANYKRLKSEYERIKSLYHEKVTSEKDYIQAEAEYKTALSRYTGLKIKIETIGFSAAKIENGEVYAFYSIKSPINGMVSNLTATIGSYLDTRTELFEVINPERFQVKLSVFAKDISALKKGQSVRLKSTNTEDIRVATLSSLGIIIDDDSKTIDCYALMADKTASDFVANEFVEAEIITNKDTVKALPSGAIIRNEQGYFILVLNRQEDENYFFSKVEVKPGRLHEGFTEISDSKIEGLILTNGVYNISL